MQLVHETFTKNKILAQSNFKVVVDDKGHSHDTICPW